MDMVIAFIATLTLLCALGLALLLGNKSFKRVDEAYFIDCLERAVNSQISSDEWLVFLSLPIKHDPWLEKLKLEILEINETFDLRTVKESQLPMQLMDEEGLMSLAKILERTSNRPYKDF